MNPLVAVDLVIDHSVQVDLFRSRRRLPGEHRAGSTGATASATRCCGGRSRRSTASASSRPGAGICHQVNLEHLGQAWSPTRDGVAMPDTLVGTDSHTTMINGLGVLGWGVGGIEAEAAMLGQPMFLPPPGRGRRARRPARCRPGTTATDLVLTLTQMLRAHGVVGQVRRVLRATAARRWSSPTARRSRTCAPSTARPRRSSRSTTRRCATCASPAASDRVDLVERYAKEQGLFRTRRRPRAGLQRGARPRPVAVEPSAGGPEAAAGPRAALRRLAVVRRGVPRRWTDGIESAGSRRGRRARPRLPAARVAAARRRVGRATARW